MVVMDAEACYEYACGGSPGLTRESSQPAAATTEVGEHESSPRLLFSTVRSTMLLESPSPTPMPVIHRLARREEERRGEAGCARGERPRSAGVCDGVALLAAAGGVRCGDLVSTMCRGESSSDPSNSAADGRRPESGLPFKQQATSHDESKYGLGSIWRRSLVAPAPLWA